MPYRISVDTGGTFTDVVVSDESGQLHLAKALTTPEKAFEAITAGLQDIAERIDVTFSDLLAAAVELKYGTTRATNSIIEGKTARTAFFTTEGFPDILLMREGGKLEPFRQIPYPPPYVPRHLTFEICERMDAEGTPFLALDETSVLAAIDGAVEAGCKAVGVCLLWATVNPAHELRVGELLQKRAPHLAYTLSHQLNPILREYRRASSTVIDASLKPIMQELLETLDRDLAEAGFRGHLLLSTSFGGSWRPQEMIERPIYSVGSGPSMAPVAALTYGGAELSDEKGTPPDLLVCDTGGTTFDVGLVSGGEIHYSAETWIGGRWIGHITGTRSVDVRSIGAGGGSIVWIDSGGLAHVGPQSAGSDPGPTCYGRGGTLPTVTDAAFILGYLDASNFLGGRLALDRNASEKAFEPLAAQLGMDLQEVANLAIVLASENMVGAIREITIAQGIDPRDMMIVAGGGASGLNIIPIARELGCPRVLLPSTAGVLSACGALYSDIISEFSASLYQETRSLSMADANKALAAVESRADAFLLDLADLKPTAQHKWFSVDARYRQQVWELTVPLAGSRVRTQEDIDAIETAFHELHKRVFAVSEPGQYLECLVWKARALAELEKPPVAPRSLKGHGETVPTEFKPAYFRDLGEVSTPRYDGELLSVGAVIDGPAVVREPTTTLVVYSGSKATVTHLGNYMIDTMVQQNDGVRTDGKEVIAS